MTNVDLNMIYRLNFHIIYFSLFLLNRYWSDHRLYHKNEFYFQKTCHWYFRQFMGIGLQSYVYY